MQNAICIDTTYLDMKKLFNKIKSNKKAKIAIVLILVVIIGFSIYKIIKNKSASTETKPETITAKVERGNLKETVSASGQIETANYLPVTTSVNGIVNKVDVKEGDIVTKGQAIMDITLNSDGEENRLSAWSSYLSAKSSLESAKNSLINAESSLINAEESFQDEKENNSFQSHDERISYTLEENSYNVARSERQLAQDAITQRQVALSKAWLTYQAQSPTIVAPGDGVIANIVVVEGMDIANSLSERTSSTVASIKKEGTPIASLNISEVDINKVQVGQQVELTLSSIQNKVFTGEVVGIDKIGTASSGVANYPVIVKFDEESSLVLPNMGVDADIIIEQKENAVYVPSAAVVSMKGKTMVRIKDGQDIKNIPVELGVTTNEYSEIISGLQEGQEVLINTLPTSGFTTTNSDQFRGPTLLPGAGGGRR